MVRDEYPRDCVTSAVPDGQGPIPFHDDEPDENELPDTAIGYGSLLSLGTSLRKKRPFMVLDPVEAENEARRVQFVAAQQLVDADGPEAIEFLGNLAYFAEPDIADGDFPCPEMPPAEGSAPAHEAIEGDAVGLGMARDEAGFEHSIDADEENQTDEPEAGEALADSGAPPDLPEEPAEASDREMPLELPDTIETDEADDFGSIVTATELETSRCETPRQQPSSGHHGHSLRARVPRRKSPRTLADHIVAFVARLHDWLTRIRR